MASRNLVPMSLSLSTCPRSLLVAVAPLLFFFSFCLCASPAFAEEPARSAKHERIRNLLLNGRGFEARAAIGDRLAGDIPLSERAALLELYALGAAWSWERPRQVDDPRLEAPFEEELHTLSPAEWRASFQVARQNLAQGAIASAARRLKALTPQAPDYIDAMCAEELRSIAFAALRTYEAPVESTPTTSPTTPPIPPRPPTPPTRWYGWQTLIADGIAIVATPFSPTTGAALYLTAAPGVHVLNGNIKRAGASIGARVGLPLGGALGGALMGAVLSDEHRRSESALALGAVGGVLGVLSAVTVDAAMIAKEPIPAEQKEQTSTVGSLRPTVAPRKEGGLDVSVVATW